LCGFFFAISTWTHISSAKKDKPVASCGRLVHDIDIQGGRENDSYSTGAFNRICIESTSSDHSGAVSSGLFTVATRN
jgi:hypothetical protein